MHFTDKQSQMDLILAKDKLIFKDKLSVVGVRVWRSSEVKLLERKWSPGHVALKIYGEENQYISFFPGGCSSKKCQNDHSHLHTEEQDAQGTPEEFLIKVDDIMKMNAESRKLMLDVIQGKRQWTPMYNCSRMVFDLLNIGGVKLNPLWRHKLILKLWIIDILKKYGLYFNVGCVMTTLVFVKKFDVWVNLILDYEERKVAENKFLREKISMKLTVIKRLISYTNHILVQSQKIGIFWGVMYGAAGIILLQMIMIYSLTLIRSRLTLTPEEVYLIVNELDLRKKYSHHKLKTIKEYCCPSLLHSEFLITDHISVISIINTIQISGELGILYQLTGHAAIVVEATIEHYISILETELILVEEEIKSILKKQDLINEQEEKLNQQLKIQNNFIKSLINFIAKKIWTNNTYENITKQIETLHNELYLCDQEKDKLKSKHDGVQKNILILSKLTKQSRYIGIYDIHAKAAHKFPSLVQTLPEGSGQNLKGYIHKISLTHYIYDPFKGVVEILPDGVFELKALHLWNLLQGCRKNNNRVYELGQNAVKQLIKNVMIESTQVGRLLQEEKITHLPKWQLLGKYSLFPFKDWDGLNCSEWCNQQLYKVGAISIDEATAKSKPPKGIQQILLEGCKNLIP